MDLQNNEDKYTIPSLKSAGEILKYLSSFRVRKSTLTEISNKLDINKSTCYRILHTLVGMKMVTYEADTKTFSLGPYIMILGKRAERFMDFMPIVKEYMEEIVGLSNATCALVQRMENKWFYIEKREPNSGVRVTINVGQRFKLTSGATGKLFLAYMERKEQEKFIDLLGLEKCTDKTNVDKSAFLAELAKIREKEYAVSIEEHFSGIDGVAAPIIDNSGEVKMAITLIILHSGQTEEKIEEIGQMLRRKVEELSKKINST